MEVEKLFGTQAFEPRAVEHYGFLRLTVGDVALFFFHGAQDKVLDKLGSREHFCEIAFEGLVKIGFGAVGICCDTGSEAVYEVLVNGNCLMLALRDLVPSLN